MKRTLISETPKLVDQKVLIKGWVNSLRSHGKVSFADIRDRSGVIQVVGDEKLAELKPEYAVSITGKINSRSERYFNPKLVTGQIEIEMESFEIISPASDLPFDVHQEELNVSLPVLLDNRPASLRHSATRDIFTIQAVITDTFRQYLLSQDFTEFHAPTIVAGSSEGGSQVFPVDYFGYQAYLAQSPQLYKQVMVTAYERVFTIAHAYRAEPSVTTRHLTEYVSLDAEMGFIDSWQDVVDMADSTVKAIFSKIAQDYSDILTRFQVTLPKTVIKTPQLKLSEALEIVSQRSGRNVSHDLDLDPEGEREICRWALEEHGSDLVFITHFPTKKRAWYSYADPQNPEETLSFDLIGCGVEWISGSQRISDYQQLLDKIKAIGQKPEDYEYPYLQSFRYGMPPEGGFALGLERITQNILGLENIRQATLFPRDMERIDIHLPKHGRPFVFNPPVNAKKNK